MGLPRCGRTLRQTVSRLIKHHQRSPLDTLQRGVHNSSDGQARAVKTVQSSPYAQTHSTATIINFGLGQPSPSLLPLDIFETASLHRFQYGQDSALLQYGAGQGYRGFRKDLAALLSATQPKVVDPDALLITAGNSQAISHAAMTFSTTNKRVFVEEPTYFLAYDIFRELGLELAGIQMDKDGLNVDILEEQLRKGDVPAFIYTIPFFHNPTGTILPPERCQRLVELAEQYGFYIISDEPYNLLNIDGTSLPSLASYTSSGRVLSLGSFSKILAPGLRLGWVQSGKETIQSLSSIGVIRSGGGQNPVTAALVHSVLQLDLLRPYIENLRKTFQKRRDVMCQALRDYCPDVDFVVPHGGYFVWLQLPDKVDANELLQEGQTNHGVAFTPGSRCSLGPITSLQLAKSTTSPVMMSQCARLSFAFYSDDEIRLGVERLGEALRVIGRRGRV